MPTLVMILSLVLVTIVAVWIGEMTRLPYPVLLLLFVAGLSFVPPVPVFTMDPEIILPLFLPPLLFAVARRASWSVFVRRWRTLLILAVFLTAVTACAVAGMVMWLFPAATLPLALALGAMVSPPDPVAVEAVAEPAKVPRGIMRTLQTESLFNDAVAIVLFTTAVSAVEGDGRLSTAFGRFLAGVAIAGLVGFLLGWIVSIANRGIHNVAATGAVTMVAPFIAYLAAEKVHASGVIAVVVTALEINRREVAEASRDRILTSSFWEVVDLLVTGVAFGLVGSELRQVVSDEGWDDIAGYLPLAFVVVGLVILVRFLAMGVLRWVSRVGGGGGVPRNWRDCLVLTWCGMRGLATLALALSLPEWGGPSNREFRSFAVVVGAVVLFVTLVPAGLLLPWLIRVLDLAEDESSLKEEAAELADRAQHAAYNALEHYFENQDFPISQREELREWADRIKIRLESDQQWDHVGGSELTDTAIRSASEIRNLVIGAQSVALEAARAEILEARNDPTVDVGTVEQVLRRLDLRTLSLPRNRPRTQTREARSGTANLAQRRGRINPVENIAKRVNARRHRSAEMDD